MKRTNSRNKAELKLKDQLQLVRATIRVLTPTQLAHVNVAGPGTGTGTGTGGCVPTDECNWGGCVSDPQQTY
jgi:hypothetical protein